jgi:hypothetical protein
MLIGNYPESVIRIRERLFRADEMRGERRNIAARNAKQYRWVALTNSFVREKQFAAMKIAPVRLLYR